MTQYIKRIVAVALTAQVLMGCTQQFSQRFKEREDYHNLSCDEIMHRLSVAHAKFDIAQAAKENVPSTSLVSPSDRILIV